MSHRALGTMIIYGYTRVGLDEELDLAATLGAARARDSAALERSA